MHDTTMSFRHRAARWRLARFVVALASALTACSASTNDCLDAQSCDDALPRDASVDASPQADADAVAVDAPDARDGAAEVPEPCDGLDNDGDGLVDEGLATVGEPTTIVPGAEHRDPLILGTPAGFGILYRTIDVGGGGTESWVTLDAGGTTAPPTVVRTLTAWAGARAILDGTVVRVAGTETVCGTWGCTTGCVLYAFSALDGTWVWPTSGMAFPMSATASWASGARITGASGNHASFYMSAAMVAPRTIERYRVQADAAPPVLGSFDVGPSSPWLTWDVLTAAGTEYVVADDNAGTVVFATPASDSATEAVLLGSVQSDALYVNEIALAVRSADNIVSPTNPLAVALVLGAGGGIVFVQILGDSPLTVGAPIYLPDAVGTDLNQDNIALVAAEPGPNPGHFFVAVADSTGSIPHMTQTLRVWETMGEPPVARRISIANDEIATASGLTAAASGDAIRIAHVDATGEVVMRELGCH